MHRFSAKELQHLFISVLVMSFVVSYSISYGADLLTTLYAMPFSLLIIAPAFVFHELGHKFTAQKYGYHAEYRMWIQGLLLALIVVLFSGFIFIAPGAVYFSARGVRGLMANKSIVGKIGLSGPVVNLVLVAVFGIIGTLSPAGSVVQSIGIIGAYVNSFLALFNLLPIGPLDGNKIMAWSKSVWALALVLAIASFGLTFSLINSVGF